MTLVFRNQKLHLRRLLKPAPDPLRFLSLPGTRVYHGAGAHVTSTLFITEGLLDLHRFLFWRVLSLPGPRVHHVAGAHVTPLEGGRRLALTVTS